MKKICVVTATRAEYGCLKWLISDILNEKKLQLQLLVTGAHLVSEQGNTISEIQEDKIPITSILDVQMDNSDMFTIGNTLGRLCSAFAKEFKKLNPDIVIILGDRYELLAICSVAFMMNISIAHISGGDITEGALDDGIRNAITMLATYHFPGTIDSAKNIIRMRNTEKNIFVVGEPSIDAFKRISLLSKEELSNQIQLDQQKKWVLLTYHPETKETIPYNTSVCKTIIQVLLETPNIQVIITKANSDLGGKEINDYFSIISKKHTDNFFLISSLGQLRYLSLMKNVSFVIGNSSSGIIETPFFSIPTINIGNRQKGRYQCSNIIQSGISKANIHEAIKKSYMLKKIDDWNYWGDGDSSKKIISILTK